MNDAGAAGGGREQGFTLIEALVAMVILMFGLAAVANLMVVAGSSNSVANHSTAATTVATQTMELLKSTPSNLLATGGSVTGDVGATGECGVTPVIATYNCNTRNLSASDGPQGRDFAGVGTMHVRWRIHPPTPVGSLSTRFIEVSAESMSPIIGRRSRLVLTTFRTDNP